MYRGWMDKAIFRGESYSRRDAWAWLIEHAAFADTSNVERGQLRCTLRFLAQAWGWDDPKVRRFLSRAQQDDMLARVTDAGQTLITIGNYELYQASSNVGDAPKRNTPTRHRRVTDAHNKEGKNEEGNPPL
jgi:hypothetical protein